MKLCIPEKALEQHLVALGKTSELNSSGLLSKPGQGMLAANKEALFL